MTGDFGRVIERADLLYMIPVHGVWTSTIPLHFLLFSDREKEGM
jgi:hypothetical protein